ncbi:MAG: proline--tRNA ligase [Candidatus Kerfeldbacteria bacterium CG_4_9_14_3_um_filter_45_8]|nr:MAG: proline--tRNA ligase [Candidatus Kerfeldbacteria bacterium CG_4_9_14_3_um_filter_45_8]
MRMKKIIPRTRREVAEGLSGAHALLVRAGYIRQVTAGVFVLTHLGWRVLRKIEAIIFAEMEHDDVLNIQMPIIQPAELWEQTGRWDKYVRSGTMFQTTSSSGQRYGLAPTAEEVVTWLAASEVSSWRDLDEDGLHFHQIGWKYRDETRPHGGLLRGREFNMSDAYSFDVDEEGMRRSFDMYRAMYWRIFAKVGLHRLISVQADSGAIGGSGSAEFMALSDVGEDVLLTCDSCDYGANVERATSRWPRQGYDADRRTRRNEHTPGTKTVEELEALFGEDGVTARHMVKTIILTCNAETDPFEVAVCIRGDLEINLVKVRNALNVDSVVAAAASVVIAATGAEVGFAGPLGLENVRRILFDKSVEDMVNFLCGLNRTDYHALDVNFGTEDLPLPSEFRDLHTAVEGHGCPNCNKGHLHESHGVEVGHIFQLGTIYSEPMGATYTDANGKDQVIWMGCYGIGVTRLLQAVVDQNRDDAGICWPASVAPFHVHIVPINTGDSNQACGAASGTLRRRLRLPGPVRPGPELHRR